jgi:signal transduction histidine kinase
MVYLQRLVTRGRSTSDISPHHLINSVGMAIALGIAYFMSARLSLYFLTKPDGVAVFWPAAGVSTGVLISIGPRARLPVIAGTMAATVAANLLGDRNIWSTIVFALSNAIEAMVMAALIERYFDQPFSLDKLRNVVGLLAAAIVATAISGIVGTLGFRLFHGSPTSFLTVWHHWFLSDAIGIVTVAPLLIGLFAALRDPPPPNEISEGAAMLVLLVIASGIIVLLPREPWMAVLPAGLFFPLLLWVTARCRPVFAAAAAFVVTLMLVWTTTFGIGILGDPTIPVTERIIVAQASILTASFCALVLAALFAERKANEVHLAHSNMMLERERDNKLMNMQAVTRAMAHELKQPLTAISANSEAVQQLFLSHSKPSQKEMESALDSLVEDSHRAGQILDDIRDLFFKSDSGHEPVDVNEIASRVLGILRGELKAHGVASHLELASDLPLVLGHKGQMQEVLINLVQNAIEAMKAVNAGHRRLSLRTERLGGDAIAVEVRDSGPGIHSANLAGVFDAFFTTKLHGTGLGLAICRMIIERHGGQLSASSDGTHGALFQFVLPTRDALAENAPTLN